MKKAFRIPLFLLIALLLLALCGCSRFETPENEIAGIIGSGTGPAYTTTGYSISPNSMELTYKEIPYTYSINHGEDSVTYTIYYPNGGKYYETRGSGTGTSGWNEEYDIGTTYADGETLVDVLSSHYYISHFGPNFGHYLILLVCLGVGCFNIFLPEAAWNWAHLFRSWQYKNAEPSDAGIAWTRYGGIILLVMGVILFFCNWS